MSIKRFCAHCGKPSSDRIVRTCDRCQEEVSTQVDDRLDERVDSASIVVDNRYQLIFCPRCAKETGITDILIRHEANRLMTRTPG